MRPLLIVLAGTCASIATSGLVWLALVRTSSPYCEIVQAQILRTTANELSLNLAVAEALESARRPNADAEQALADSRYRESIDVWFSNPDLFGQRYERVSRFVRRQLDETGEELQVEVLRGFEMPTLVFVEHESRATRERVVREIAQELAAQGVATR